MNNYFTTRGRNWFYELCTRGQDPAYPEYRSWNFPTESNPRIDRGELEAARATLPERVWMQEFLALFLEDVGAVFRNVDACIGGDLEEPIPGRRYVLGVDLAKHRDFTVLIVVDMDSWRVVAFDRFQKLDWPFQRKRIVNFAMKYNRAQVIMDSTGVGDPTYDDLSREYPRVEGYRISAATKPPLIENLSVMIENGEITYPEIPDLINELKIFGYENKNGRITYETPQGYHDDCVIALALACWHLRVGPRGKPLLVCGP